MLVQERSGRCSFIVDLLSIVESVVVIYIATSFNPKIPYSLNVSNIKNSNNDHRSYRFTNATLDKDHQLFIFIVLLPFIKLVKYIQFKSLKALQNRKKIAAISS